MNTDNFDSRKLSPEQQEYLKRVSLASETIAKILKENPEFDRADLFHIFLKSYDQPEVKLAVGLRRRILGYV